MMRGLLFVMIIITLLFVGCVRPTAETTTPSPEQQELDMLKFRLEEAQEELDSYKLIEENWEYWENVKALMQKTLTRLSEVRELSAPEQVGFRVMTVYWAQKKWGEEYVKENAKKIEIDERIFKGLFVLPEEASLAGFYTEWPRSYLLAKSDSKMYFILENFGKLSGEEAREALAHDVVHLLQGKHFKDPELSTYDEDKAWSALVEGDADFSRSKYLEEALVEAVPQIGQLPAIYQVPQLQTPQALNRLLSFPYDYGRPFVSSLHEKGGWQQVNEAYLKPPATTAQILHPDKYFNSEGIRNIVTLPPKIAGWQEERTDRLGEYFIRVMLGNHLSEQEASAAAQGWAADKLTYYVWQQAYLFTWQTAWFSNQDEIEFCQAFLEMLANVGAKQVESNLWLCSDEYIWIKKTDDQSVTIIVSEEKGMIDAVLKVLP